MALLHSEKYLTFFSLSPQELPLPSLTHANVNDLCLSAQCFCEKASQFLHVLLFFLHTYVPTWGMQRVILGMSHPPGEHLTGSASITFPENRDLLICLQTLTHCSHFY